MDKRGLTRRHIVRIVSFAAAAFVALGGFAWQLHREQKRLERFMEASYQHSFAELVEGVSALEHALQKELYATSPLLIGQLSNEVARASAGAQSMMAQIPFAFEELEETARFLSQTGDYAASLARSASSGGGLNDEQRQTMQSLSESARSLAQRLVELQTIVNEENLQLAAVLKAEEDLESDEPKLFGDTFKDFADELSGLPALVYDGPFSTHMEQSEAKMTADEADIGADEALQAALDFLSLGEGQLELAYESGGKLPSYVFTGHLDGGELSVEISRQGGFAVSMACNAAYGGEEKLDITEAIRAADAFLEEKGYTSMEHSYHQKMGGFLLINYLYMHDGIACYPDLCKVGVSLETGKIVRFESMSYLQNHDPRRDIPPAAISAEEAVSIAQIGGLSQDSAREVLIPSTRGELHCYELACTASDGTHVLIYVNAQTGVEEKILILLEDDNGTLAI